MIRSLQLLRDYIDHRDVIGQGSEEVPPEGGGGSGGGGNLEPIPPDFSQPWEEGANIIWWSSSLNPSYQEISINDGPYEELYTGWSSTNLYHSAFPTNPGLYNAITCEGTEVYKVAIRVAGDADECLAYWTDNPSSLIQGNTSWKIFDAQGNLIDPQDSANRIYPPPYASSGNDRFAFGVKFREIKAYLVPWYELEESPF